MIKDNTDKFILKDAYHWYEKYCSLFLLQNLSLRSVSRMNIICPQKFSDFLQLLVDAEKELEKQHEVDAEIDHRSQLHTSAQWTRKGN